MRSSVILVVFIVSCSSSRPAEPAADSGKAESREFRQLVGELVDGYIGEVEALCPCRVEQRLFESVDECVRRLAHEPSFADCLDEMLAPDDSPELREALDCSATRSSRRIECFLAGSCEVERTSQCYVDAGDCPNIDGQLLTKVLSGCPDRMLLAR